ncbi:MAG: GNAT family N-acetyltransferase [Planctomycetes bacterium]|nr:GNAT family N-acetyltransferase [Planctomycetota bacterium]MCB9918528.1 GNAT family N-acetyltransferase [Planctomycetota bacterium]
MAPLDANGIEATEIRVQAFGPRAMKLLDAFEGDPWLDFARRGDDGGLPECVGRDVLAAFDGDEPVGLLVVDRSPLGIELTIAVLSARRRCGVGSVLIAHADRLARDERVNLWVRVARANQAAIAFFENHGFEAESPPPTRAFDGLELEEPAIVESHVCYVLVR